MSKDDLKQGRLQDATRVELLEMFDKFLGSLKATNDGALLIVDEAHSLPPATKEQVMEIAVTRRRPAVDPGPAAAAVMFSAPARGNILSRTANRFAFSNVRRN